MFLYPNFKIKKIDSSKDRFLTKEYLSQLEVRIDFLEKKIATIEFPFSFNIGDKVVVYEENISGQLVKKAEGKILEMNYSVEKHWIYKDYHRINEYAILDKTDKLIRIHTSSFTKNKVQITKLLK